MSIIAPKPTSRTRVLNSNASDGEKRQSKQSKRRAKTRLSVAFTLAAATLLLVGITLRTPVARMAPAPFPNNPSTVFINEFHYDDASTDANEFIEVAAPAGTNMANYSIVLYNGANSLVYDTDALAGVTTNQQGGYGTVSFTYPQDGIQNGSPDGIALVNTSTNTLIQFLCYEGLFTGSGGPANGVQCTNIGVSENGSGAEGASIQLQGTGSTYGDFTWAVINTLNGNTKNAVNTGQTFTGGGDIAPSVTTTSPADSATNVAIDSSITITFSESVNATSSAFTIDCPTGSSQLFSQTSSPSSTFTLDPTSDLPQNTTCTVTVVATQVTDDDADDPPNQMVSNFVFSFTTAAPTPSPTPTPISGSVVISQVYGGGGNAGATLKNDFIELVNHTGAAIDLTGWSVQYNSAAEFDAWDVTPLSGVIQPGHYFLIKQAAGAGGTVDLPTPDATGTVLMSSTAAKVALVGSTSALIGACPSSASLIDLVGYGNTATCVEGSGPAPTLNNTTAALRGLNGCLDTDNNASDFSAGSPNPRNSSSPPTDCTALAGIGSANPSSLLPGDSTTLSVQVFPATSPPSTGISVVADLSSIGGSSTQAFTGAGNTFTFLATVAAGTPAGDKLLPVTITDTESRFANATIVLKVQAEHVVISQIYPGGGNNGATLTHDYVELYNPSNITTFTITGWSLQYASANGTTWTNKQPLGGTIGPGEYYLVQLASGGDDGAPLPVLPNISGDINMAAAAGKVALVNNSDSLAGACPVGSDVNIVDFVGYGTTANCREGSANTPAPSETLAVFRKNDGEIDTDQNGADFVTGAPNPRRTAPIVELGPWVSGTDPFGDSNNAPYDATVTIDFSEPVDVTGAWYNISCAFSGLHNDATVATFDNFQGYHITPNTSFQFGEQCTVTIIKDFVSDQDLDDSGADTDHLFADHVFTFTVTGAGALAPYEPSVHLALGNPSNAIASLLEPNNFLMEKPAFSLSYNRDKGTPNWVSWHLDTDWVGTLARVDTFRADPRVSPDWYRVQSTDYFSSGFDRGHMTPNADRDHQNRIPINQETFLMSNIVPQAPDNNQGPWADMENELRTLLTIDGDQYELYIVSGPVGVGGTGSNGPANTIANGNVTVPEATWKVVLMMPKGENDLTRISAATRTIAVMMPNIQGIRNNDWQIYLTTVDAVEQETGYNFFANVPDAIENAIEAGTNGSNPPGTENQSATTAEDNSTAITLTAVSPQTMPTFTFTVVNGPTNGVLSGTGANLSYQPNPDFNGVDSFTFKANDGSKDSNVSTVNITVTAVNDAPVANNDAYSTDSNITLNVTAPGVLGNDVDVDSVSLTVELVSGVANGSLTLNPDGSFSYDPADDYTGPDSFTYRVFDGVAYSNDATVNITVNDTVGPYLNSTIGMTSLSVTNSNLVNVGLTATATDNGGAPVTIQVAVYGDEDDETPTIGTTVHSPDAKDLAPLTLRLRGERVEANDGRVYLIIVTATDNVGNITRAVHTVVVPKNNKPANVAAVEAQAATAKAFAEANGVPPPSYFVVGDGLIIGPKQ